MAEKKHEDFGVNRTPERDAAARELADAFLKSLNSIPDEEAVPDGWPPDSGEEEDNES